MASTAAPYGLQPISDLSGTPRPVRMPLGILNQYNTNIFKYGAVKLDPTTGTLQAVTATTDQIFGIFAGVEYTPLGGRPAESPFWAAGTNYDTGYDMFVYVWPAWIPGTRFLVQADGAVAQAKMGSQFNISNFAAGNTSTGLGACTLAAAGVASGSQGQFALEEFYTGINDAVGDAFTDLIVTTAFPQIGLGSQHSIG